MYDRNIYSYYDPSDINTVDKYLRLRWAKRIISSYIKMQGRKFWEGNFV
jgi:hypothetical protein